MEDASAFRSGAQGRGPLPAGARFRAPDEPWCDTTTPQGEQLPQLRYTRSNALALMLYYCHQHASHSRIDARRRGARARPRVVALHRMKYTAPFLAVLAMTLLIALAVGLI